MTASDAAGQRRSKYYLLEKQRMVVDSSTGVSIVHLHSELNSVKCLNTGLNTELSGGMSQFYTASCDYKITLKSFFLSFPLTRTGKQACMRIHLDASISLHNLSCQYNVNHIEYFQEWRKWILNLKRKDLTLSTVVTTLSLGRRRR